MPEKSDFIRRIEDVYDGLKAQRDYYMLGFLDRADRDVTYYGVPASERPWDIHDECRRLQPEKAHRLLFAFNLMGREFNSQMRQHFWQVTSWEPFKRHPLLYLPERPLSFSLQQSRGAHLSLVSAS